jgi:hypothetical protein
MTKEEMSLIAHNIVAKIQRVGFWVLLLLMLGACVGAYGMRVYNQSNIADWVKAERFIYDGKVFNVTLDPTRNK